MNETRATYPQIFQHMVIAEIGSVHDGSYGNALKLVDLAKEVGANAVKFQTHFAELEVTPNSPRPEHFSTEDRFEYFKRTGFSESQWTRLKGHADQLGIEFLSSGFSSEAIRFLDEIGVVAHKVPSGELSNVSLLEAVGASSKPTLLSTGMSNWKEISRAITVLRRSQISEIAVMQCTSLYPCPPEKVGLNVLNEISEKYGTTVGFSDHTSGLAAPIAAAALGASVIEKHLTFSKRMYGSDARHAMEPADFARMVEALNEVWRTLSSPVDKDNLTDLLSARKTFQPRIVASRDISRGTIIREEDLTLRKSPAGLDSSELHLLVGKSVTKDIGIYQAIEEKDVEN